MTGVAQVGSGELLVAAKAVSHGSCAAIPLEMTQRTVGDLIATVTGDERDAVRFRGIVIACGIIDYRNQFGRSANSSTNRSMKSSTGPLLAGRMTNFVKPASR